MLTFFRRIRKGLLDFPSDRVSRAGRQARKPASPAGRYLLYAVGEITLVVIGILIALQINNWNNKRIADKNEQELMMNIIEDLSIDFQVTTELLQQVTLRQEILRQILTESISDFPTNNRELYSAAIVETSDVISITWNNHKGSTEKISNRKFRSDLNQYFNQLQILLKYSGILNDIILNELRPYLRRNEIINLNAVLESSSNRDDINRDGFFHSDKLLEGFGTKEFNGIVVELTLGTQDVIQWLESLLENNKLLRSKLKAALN